MATIKDVAERAGVSVATVSRAMNSKDTVSERTRRRVYRVMKELNYQPNAMARALQMKRSNIIGLIVPGTAYGFFGKLTDAVERACSRRGYKLMLCCSSYDGSRETEMVQLLRANKVDGILVCSHLGDTSIYEDADLPIVSMDREIPGITSVTADNYAGGRLAASALLESGCRRPMLLSGAIPAYMAAYDRLRGFLDACQEAGVECRQILVKDFRENADLRQCMAQVMAQPPEGDGIFTTSDIMAAHLITNAPDSWKLPVVGFDGLEISAFLGIPTIAQPIADMGSCAVDLLIRKIEGQPVPQRSVLDVKLVRR